MLKNTQTLTQEEKHQCKSNLCFYKNECYETNDIIIYHMEGRTYNSLFEGDTFDIQINKTSAKELDEKGILKAEWFNNNHGSDNNYKHEEEIINFIETLIIENQEYIYNCPNSISELFTINREDWIKDVYRNEELLSKSLI